MELDKAVQRYLKNKPNKSIIGRSIDLMKSSSQHEHNSNFTGEAVPLVEFNKEIHYCAVSHLVSPVHKYKSAVRVPV